MSQQIEGVSITCDKELMIQCEERQAQLKWSFKVQSERPLVHVALLKQEPGATFTLTQDGSPKVRSYAEGNRFSTSDRTFLIEIFFESVNSGIYEQWVVFDFDMRPVLVQKIQVRVGQQNFVQPDMCLDGKESGFADLERWNSGNRIIVPCFEKTEAEQQLLKKYKAPVLTLQYKQRTGEKTPITQMNYKEQMHSFLNREEQAEEEVLSKLSQKVTISTTDVLDGPLSGMKIAPPGDLFAKVPVAYALTPDTNEGYLLKKAVQLALLAPNPQVNNKVYETTICWDANTEKNIYLQLSKRCCSDLDFQKDKEYDVEVQFQMDRLRSFCTWHLAVDLLPEVKIVLPDFAACSVPVSGGTFPKGNAKQQIAISFIVGDRTGPVAPLLIYGPFGTGKTFTLANAAMETVRQPGTRVLICTHTNSAADLYVKEHLHNYVSSGHPEAVPLRIKYETLHLNSTDAITLQYCHLSEDRHSFTFPDRAMLDSHRIIITTTETAKHFHDLKLPRGYFTHILIDEASQMLECAAIMPLSLATSTTRVVLAGDHMQMSPKLFSVGGSQCSDYTLLNRLFHFYQKQKHEVAKKSRIIFNENYRSTKGIIDFVSTHFYIKGDTIKASGNVPPHPRFHPLMFYHVHGTCTPDPSTMSWFNVEEINQVAETVQGLLKDWPTEWGNPEQRTICVVSDGAQVILIRKKLRNRNLGKVTVENLANIQGKQFRVIVITTVQTRESLLTSNSDNLEFFNEAQVLNTAMTRAQSQVIVVGDAAGLCYFGSCSKIWKSYIKQCVNEGTAYPEYLTMDSIDRAVVEFTKFIKTEEEDDSDTESFTSEFNDNIDDPILQELLDETKNMTVTVTDEGLLDIFHNNENDRSSQEQDFYQEQDSPKQREDLYTDFPEPTLNLYLQMQPNIYKLCELVLEKFDSGYGRPFNEPMMQIRIKGRKNIGMSFPGDHVAFQADPLPDPGNELSGQPFQILFLPFFSALTGTGKTMVGVHIVYWFHKMNLEASNAKKTRETNEAEETKKTCILYCGPSNKSVDVVAAQHGLNGHLPLSLKVPEEGEAQCPWGWPWWEVRHPPILPGRQLPLPGLPPHGDGSSSGPSGGDGSSSGPSGGDGSSSGPSGGDGSSSGPSGGDGSSSGPSGGDGSSSGPSGGDGSSSGPSGGDGSSSGPSGGDGSSSGPSGGDGSSSGPSGGDGSSSGPSGGDGSSSGPGQAATLGETKEEQKATLGGANSAGTSGQGGSGQSSSSLLATGGRACSSSSDGGSGNSSSSPSGGGGGNSSSSPSGGAAGSSNSGGRAGGAAGSSDSGGRAGGGRLRWAPFSSKNSGCCGA
ncbi:UNVERIFIED_CONTAM: hypothetical protein FKN15_001877 [Acipenser sinensis]